MHARFIVVAATLLMSASAFAADAPKLPNQPAAQPQPPRAQIVLASAGDVVPAASPSDEGTTNPPKHRVGRVSSCRCGGQEAIPEDDPEDDPNQ